MTAILVTGATGFIGRSLVAALARRGYRVRTAVRHKEQRVDGADETVAVGTIGPTTDWRPAVDGVDLIVHAAARVHVAREIAADPLAAFRSVNVLGTAGLAAAARTTRAKRLVFLSSIKAMAEESGAVPLTEATPAQPMSPYGISKLEAEKAILDQLGGSACILRPPLVYGPGVGANFLQLMRLCATGLPIPLGAVRNSRSLVFLENLIDAVALCLEHPSAGGRTFLIQDGAPLSTPDLVRGICAALGRTPRIMNVPPDLLRLTAALVGKRDTWARLAGSLAVDDSALRRDLGWTPRTTIETGLQETARWFSQ